MSATSTAVVSSPAKEIVRESAQFANKIQSLVTAPNRTPTSAKPAVESPIPSPSPGSFRHPRLTEIISRQSQSSLTDRNLRKATVNLGALVLTLSLNSILYTSLNTILETANIPDATVRTGQIVTILRLFFLTNVILALRPIIPYLSTKDEITDIPLTPSQRSLLGLNPSVQSPAGSSAFTGSSGGYITPPRYRRFSSSTNALQNTSNTDMPTDRRSISATYFSSSPLSSSQSPYYNTSIRSSSSSSFNPLTTTTNRPFSITNSPAASPLFHKALAQQKQQYDSAMAAVSHDLDFSASTASVFGSPVGLSRSQSLRERKRHHGGDDVRDNRGPGQHQKPLPTASSRASGINYKWLYDKSTSSSANKAAGGGLLKSESMGF